MTRPTPIVVVTGPPASGKTTLATAIATRLELPLMSKDLIKETLFDGLGNGDHEWSRRLGAATYPLLFRWLAEELRCRRPVVVEGTFGPEYATREFAALHERWPFHALQLYCSASAEVLVERYAARAPTRHPGHLDAAIVDQVASGLDEGRWKPLRLPGRTVAIDATVLESDWLERGTELARDHVANRDTLRHDEGAPRRRDAT